MVFTGIKLVIISPDHGRGFLIIIGFSIPTPTHGRTNRTRSRTSSRTRISIFPIPDTDTRLRLRVGSTSRKYEYGGGKTENFLTNISSDIYFSSSLLIVRCLTSGFIDQLNCDWETR